MGGKSDGFRLGSEVLISGNSSDICPVKFFWRYKSLVFSEGSFFNAPFFPTMVRSCTKKRKKKGRKKHTKNIFFIKHISVNSIEQPLE